jgi:hypothetical protein
MGQDLAIFTKYTKESFINLIDTLREGGGEYKLTAFFTPKLLRGLLSIIKYLNHYITFLNRNQQLQL